MRHQSGSSYTEPYGSVFNTRVGGHARESSACAAEREDLHVEVEAADCAADEYHHAHTKRWAAKIASFDAYVFIVPEYNHGIPGALKNAIDFLFAEWNNRAAGFVSYGAAGGVRAVEQLRLVMGELMIADVRSQVALSLYTDFENFSEFKPSPTRLRSLPGRAL
jgi:NAD(P)H-dependent FMN reductase